jgi:FG-GAP-like repeat
MIKTAGLTALIMSASAASQAQDTKLFKQSELQTTHGISELKAVNFFTSGTAALMARGQGDMAGRPEGNPEGKSGGKISGKYFSFFEMNANGQFNAAPRMTVEMPEDAVFFDFAPIFDKDLQSLLFLNADGVQIFDPATGAVTMLAPALSIYKQHGSPLFNHVDFARDVNGDGLADLLIPDFGGYRLMLNDGAGGFKVEIILDMPVEMRVSGSTPRYNQFPVYAFDANFDGRMDVVFRRDNSFLAYLQQADGSYSTTAATYDFDINIVGNSFGAQVASNERYSDQSNLTETNIETIKDINGDGIMDIVTQTDRAQGLFNRSTEYGFHYGSSATGRIVYETAPSARLTMKGITANTRHIDFSNDGRVDFAGGAVNIGIGKIIGILLSGSVSIPVMFYEQDENGQYSEDPLYRKKISVDFDMSSGQSSVPVVEMTDIDGDGNKDLILSKDNDGLRIYKATPGQRKLFAKKAIEIELNLPKNGEFVTTADLNGDGKGDLMMHYSRLGADGKDKRNKIIVLIAN